MCPDSYRDVVSFVAKEVTSTQSLHEGHDVAQIIFLETKTPLDADRKRSVELLKLET